MTDLTDYRNVLKRYSELQKRLMNHKIQQFRDLMNKYQEFYQKYYEKNRVLAPNFNPLHLLNLEFEELTHSKILAWLFDPYGTHNQGDLFFRHFISYFGFNVEYDRWNYKVRREYSGSESIIDILVYGKDFIFYIENKTLSPEGYDQTNREFRDLMRLAKALGIKKNIFPIFLNPSGAKPENENWIPISYHSLSQALEKSLDAIQSDYVRLFIRSWLSILKSIKEV